MIFTQLLGAQKIELNPGKPDPSGRFTGGIIQSEGFEPGKNVGWQIKYNGDAEFNNATVRGRIEADKGYFRGRLEADDGFFRGLLETPALRSSTEQVLSTARVYAAGTTAYSIVNSEAKFWGANLNTVSGWTKQYAISGTFNGRQMSTINLRAAGRAGALDPPLDYFIIGFSDGGYTIQFSDSEQLPLGGLTFSRVMFGWNIQMRNLPIEDPKFPNVLWRDGTTLKISIG